MVVVVRSKVAIEQETVALTCEEMKRVKLGSYMEDSMCELLNVEGVVCVAVYIVEK